MTASVQYWRLPEEEVDLVTYLQSVEQTMALPLRRVATVEELVWNPIEDALREPDASFLITPARFVPAMQVHRDERGFAASVVTTPALLYSRGIYVTPQCLSSTALSAEWRYPAVDIRTMVDHPADFVRWGKKVMTWIRRSVPDWYRYKHHRITAKAEAARRAGIELMF
ncbi:MAG: hypothetical protein ACXVEE_04425 [Polyangiales bacterium]